MNANANAKRLKRAARKSAAFRGHDLTNFAGRARAGGYLYTARCKNCEATATITTYPAPNQTPAAGEALALHCTDPKEEGEQ